MSLTVQLLTKQNEQLLSLEQLLLNEKEAILESKPDNLNTITEQKQALLLSIEQTDKQIISQADFLTEKNKGSFDDLMTNIESSLDRCKDLNAVNGRIIAQSQLAVERLKNSLLEKRNKSTMTYDNKGKTQGGLSSLNFKA